MELYFEGPFTSNGFHRFGDLAWVFPAAIAVRVYRMGMLSFMAVSFFVPWRSHALGRHCSHCRDCHALDFRPLALGNDEDFALNVPSQF